MTKKIIISSMALVLVLGVAGLAVSKAYADDEDRPLPPMIQALSEKFNLNEDEVVTFMSEQRDQMHEQRVTDVEEKLSDAVSDGKITEDQKTAILNKMEEVRESGQRQQGELREWAEENGIDFFELDLRGGFGPGRGGGMNRKGGF